MSAHFKWYDSDDNMTVPFNARFSFPSQANKANKMTPRIPPKNGSTFTPGQVIRLEFPAQGYVNPLNTTIEFDVTLVGHDTATEEVIRFQNNIQSCFSRVRLMYGSTPLEDIINYNTVVRMLTEWTSTNGQGSYDQTSIAEGIGGVAWGADPVGDQGMCNVRQKFIHGISTGAGPDTPADISAGDPFGSVPQTAFVPAGVSGSGTKVTRRYQVNLALGLLLQDKLIPTKFMASQLAIEITLAQSAECIYVAGSSTVTGTPSYALANINLIPEILEFDASYDEIFIQGLRATGVPLKFASWHTFIFSSSSASNVQLQIQERSRSVKALFTVQKRSQADISKDMGAMFFDTAANGELGTLQSYQYRIGGRYFPAAPVQTSGNIGGAETNGGCEAYLELQKSLNTVGDYRLSSSVNSTRWAIGPTSAGVLPDLDYSQELRSYGAAGAPSLAVVEAVGTTGSSFSGTVGSAAFAMAVNLETSNGLEISGLNAEEQSDISLLANWKTPQVTGSAGVPSSLEVYSYYDAMIVLRENNVIELIQ